MPRFSAEKENRKKGLSGLQLTEFKLSCFFKSVEKNSCKEVKAKMAEQTQVEFKEITSKQEHTLVRLLESKLLAVLDKYRLVEKMKAQSLSSREASGLISLYIGIARFRRAFPNGDVFVCQTQPVE